MTADRDPWDLPGPRRWIEAVSRMLGSGLAVLRRDPTRPAGVIEALRRSMGHPAVHVRAGGGQQPAAALGDAFGTAPSLENLLTVALDQDVGIVSLSDVHSPDRSDWTIFLQRFFSEREKGRPGPALLVIDPPDSLQLPAHCLAASWRDSVRRGDLIIWAEEHLPASRQDLIAELAVTLAVDLCGWRLDLAASLVQAGLDDLAEPIGWLARRTEQPIHAVDPPCPLALLAGQGEAELRYRIWKAQLTALFPILERRRINFVTRYRVLLKIDEHLRSLGVSSIDEIELGAMRRQLQRSVSRQELERLSTLSRARNCLAHCKPIASIDALDIMVE